MEARASVQTLESIITLRTELCFLQGFLSVPVKPQIYVSVTIDKEKIMKHISPLSWGKIFSFAKDFVCEYITVLQGKERKLYQKSMHAKIIFTQNGEWLIPLFPYVLILFQFKLILQESLTISTKFCWVCPNTSFGTPASSACLFG